MSKKDSVRAKAKKANKERRAAMVIKVLSFNIQDNKLSVDKKDYLKQLAIEAKYYYNYVVSFSQKPYVDDFGNIYYRLNYVIIDDFGDAIRLNNVFEFNTQSDDIKIYNYKEGTYKPYTLKFLSSQMKHGILGKSDINFRYKLKRIQKCPNNHR